MDVKKILVPNKPHLDPITAIYLLLNYGQDKFPGIEQASISFWEHSHNPTQTEIDEFNRQGTLLIDVGGGFFDHHQQQQNEAKETSSSLVAAYLGIEQNPELGTLLNYIREDDLEGLHNRYGELAYLLKVMYKQNKPTLEVVGTALKVLGLFQEGQLDWHTTVKTEYEQAVKLIKVKRNKRKLRIGILESDNVQVANYGLTQDNLSIVIQKRSTGHVMILTNKHHRIDLREAVAAIRKRELELQGVTTPLDPQRLQFEGKNMQIPNWFYHRSLNSFMNGSDALAKAEATKLPFPEIVRFVLYSQSTEESELCDCGQENKTCPYVAYGFIRCQEKRQHLILKSSN